VDESYLKLILAGLHFQPQNVEQWSSGEAFRPLQTKPGIRAVTGNRIGPRQTGNAFDMMALRRVTIDEPKQVIILISNFTASNAT
jgi:hypothetical protein